MGYFADPLERIAESHTYAHLSACVRINGQKKAAKRANLPPL